MNGAGGTTFALAAGTTHTAAIPGISAAGADAALRVHTPSADAELFALGRSVEAPVVPVSPTGCPTPAVVTRAALEALDVDNSADPVSTLVLDCGLARPTGTPTVDLGAAPGADVRERVAVPGAEAVFEAARDRGRDLECERLVVGETVPGGTTTAMATLAALGERRAVSSSLPENPLDRKREVVEAALAASDLAPGDCAGDPLRAVELVGDPTLAGVAGLATGALDAGVDVTLAGGTQLATAGLLCRHAGVDDPVTLATTSFVAADDSADVAGLAADADLDLVVTDPGFTDDHPAMAAYRRGEAKEGVGMGGALALAAEADALSAVRDRLVVVYDRVADDASGTDDADDTGDAGAEECAEAETP
ncbi:nicotinate-nucleotide--dimethylbenzimidazole phosphoribosyltransferase (plasmid) [Halorarum halophilum]|uniref:UPF0284 protein HUG10_19025 n=1 Tax=Halorarum halophilum TaxID=2743090 RepID=A0A7D5KW05_9EURY|nr:nicotinate-nucleotide--dimethylbenzimidazole phosphoribosyltransferase [Halobaculum halophilum]QLG29700.1 nicotinate-nucleotide--dimethylbenzimidazole phosphoribosyltransferase [Halobaculum halophilum]